MNLTCGSFCNQVRSLLGSLLAAGLDPRRPQSEISAVSIVGDGLVFRARSARDLSESGGIHVSSARVCRLIAGSWSRCCRPPGPTVHQQRRMRPLVFIAIAIAEQARIAPPARIRCDTLRRGSLSACHRHRSPGRHRALGVVVQALPEGNAQSKFYSEGEE